MSIIGKLNKQPILVDESKLDLSDTYSWWSTIAIELNEPNDLVKLLEFVTYNEQYRIIDNLSENQILLSIFNYAYPFMITKNNDQYHFNCNIYPEIMEVRDELSEALGYKANIKIVVLFNPLTFLEVN